MEILLETRTFSDLEINRNLTPEQKIDLLRQMFRIRRFEQAALRQYQTGGQMGGFLHHYIGQESVAVGTISLCGVNDHVIAGYLSHGNALAVGMSMNECMPARCRSAEVNVRCEARLGTQTKLSTPPRLNAGMMMRSLRNKRST